MSTPPGALRADEWTVQAVASHGEVVRLVRQFHYSRSAANSSTYRHGLYRVEPGLAPMVGALMGAAIWQPPTKDAAAAIASREGYEWGQVLSCSRLVCAPECPPNAASFLLGRSMRLLDRERWPVLVTWADTRQGHTGAIYRATNWRCDGETPAGDLWIGPNGEQRGRKRGGRTLRRAEMEALGFSPAPAAPKIRFVHVARRLD